VTDCYDGCILYADDLILMSASARVCDLRVPYVTSAKYLRVMLTSYKRFSVDLI